MKFFKMHNTEKPYATLMFVFAKFDPSKTGFVSAIVFKDVIKKHLPPGVARSTSSHSLDVMCHNYDTEGNNTVNYPLFMRENFEIPAGSEDFFSYKPSGMCMMDDALPHTIRHNGMDGMLPKVINGR